MKLIILFSLFFLFLTTCITQAQVLPDSSQLAALDKFWKENPDWYVYWNKVTGTPGSLYGPKTKSYGKTPELAIRNFLIHYRDLFERKINFGYSSKNIHQQKTDLSIIKKRTADNGNYFDYQQEYLNIPINGTQCTFGITKNGEIFYFSGTYYSEDIDINPIPLITYEAATSSALTNLGKTGFSQKNKKLYILPRDKKFELVWDFYLLNEHIGEGWKYVVSADNGKIISKTNTAIHVSSSNHWEIESVNFPTKKRMNELDLFYQTPHGLIFENYPQSSSLELETSLVQLQLLNSSGYLQGTYADVFKTSGQRATYKNNDPNDFTHSPYTQDFDEVNVYYHITSFRQNFINNYYTPGFNQVNVSIGWNESERKSYYDPGFDVIYFYNGVPTDPNFSRETNVIYHEYVHKIQYDRTCYYLNTTNKEYRGVLEGLADYFAYVFSGIGNILTYADPNKERNIVNPSGLDTSKAHSYGEWFSHILYHLEYITGFQDTLFMQTDNFNEYSSAFLSFRDRLINGFQNTSTKNTIQDAFADHGFGDHADNPPSPPTNLTITGSYGGNPTIQWTPPNDPDINHYKIYRKKNNESSFSLVGMTAGTSFTDYNVTIQYDFIEDDIFYFVKTIDNNENPSGESDYVNVLDTWANLNIEKVDEREKIDVELEETIPNELSISNYPNPFNPVTNISFSLPEESNVLIKIYNILGQKLETIFNNKILPGKYHIIWDGSKYSSGLYLITIQTNRAIKNLKVMLAK